MQAKLEPPWVDDTAMDLENWGNMVNLLNKLVVRIAALEDLLEVWVPRCSSVILDEEPAMTSSQSLRPTTSSCSFAS